LFLGDLVVHGTGELKVELGPNGESKKMEV